MIAAWVRFLASFPNPFGSIPIFFEVGWTGA